MNVNSRQKIILPILIIVLLILAWQVYKMVVANDYIPMPNNSTLNKNMQSLAAPAPASVAFNPITQNQVTLNPNQTQYIRLINQYQLLSMERMVAESGQEIAEAKLKAAEARSQLDKIAQFSDIDAPNPIAVKDMPSAGLQLVYTGRQNGQWSATLRKGQDLMDVAVGDTIPDNGRVVAINSNNVTLADNGASILVTFNGVIQRNANVIKGLTQSNLDADNNLTVNNQSASENPAVAQPQEFNTLTPLESDRVKTDVIAAGQPQLPGINKQETVTPDTKKNISGISDNVTPTTIDKLKTKLSADKQDKYNLVPTSTKVSKDNNIKVNNNSATLSNKTKSTFPSIPRIPSSMTTTSKSYYTIQIIADSKKERIQQFLINYDLQDRAAIHQVSRQGKNWYVATIGEYETAKKANADIGTLPKNLGRFKPFVRTSKDLA